MRSEKYRKIVTRKQIYRYAHNFLVSAAIYQSSPEIPVLAARRIFAYANG